MTVRSQPVALGSHSKPHPPAHPQHQHHHGAKGAAATDKRFSVRDGFHLKTRNDETRLAIDQQLLPQSETEAPPDPHSRDDETLGGGASGPSAQEIPLTIQLKLFNSDPAHRGVSSSNNRESSADEDGRHQCEEPPAALFSSSYHSVEAKATAARIKPSSEWLIYRQRQNLTPRRYDQRVEEMIQKVLASPLDDQQQQRPQLVAATPSAKESEVQPPSRPRQPSLSGSTYHQRVLATRQKQPPPRTLYPLGELAPLTETERTLLSSREETNRDVDRLLVTLFQQQQQQQQQHKPQASTPHVVLDLSTNLAKKQSALKFSTRRSEFREQTAAALKSRNLVSRMDELRSLPQVLEQMVQKHRAKQHQLVASHGENLILKNKRQSCINLLQRPPQTPVFPSSIEQKQQQALRRKQVFDDREEAAVRSAVNRWQTRRQQRQEEARRTYSQCQWLLLTTLALSSVNWLGKFQEWKLKRDALHQVVMARRIQAFWRERALIRRNSLSGFGHLSSASLNSPFYRMPIVMKSISLLQRAMRRWLKCKKNRHNVVAVEIIVTSWLEFQDVKFRRLILRFRKRVRDFQIMWRTWRAITDARIKLLLLVWTKLERKSKRRHGIMSSSNGRPLAIVDGSSALVHSLKAASAVSVSPEKHQKQLEGMHRHLKNGGTVQSPLSLAPAALVSSSPSPGSKKPPSIATIARTLSPKFSMSLRAQKTSDRVKHDLEFRQQIGEDFQHAMQDFYAANNNAMAHRGDSSATYQYSPSHLLAPPSPYTRGGKAVPPSLSSPSWRSPADAVAPPTTQPPHHAEKVPLHLKVSMLRHLLSEKRKAFQARKDKKREEWKTKRQQMRRIEFRYNVLEELVAYQRFQAENSVFLVLHHVSEAEMLHVMHRAQQAANAAAAIAEKQHEHPGSGFYPTSRQTPDRSDAVAPPPHTVASDSATPRKLSTLGLSSIRRSTLAHHPVKSSSLASVGSSVVELLDDDE